MSNFVPSHVALAVQSGMGSHTTELSSEVPGKLPVSRQERYLAEMSNRELHRARFLEAAQTKIIRSLHGTDTYREK